MLYASVCLCRYSIENLPFPATMVIYNINNVYSVFLINLMLFSKTRTFLSDRKLINRTVKQRKGLEANFPLNQILYLTAVHTALLCWLYPLRPWISTRLNHHWVFPSDRGNCQNSMAKSTEINSIFGLMLHEGDLAIYKLFYNCPYHFHWLLATGD